MVTQVHLLSKSGTRRVQPPPPQRLEVTISAEAHAALRTEQHRKAEKFQSDLSAAFRTVDETVRTLAADHHKSVHRVQTDLYFGHVKFCTRRKPNPWNAFLSQQGREHRRLKALGLADNTPGGKATLPSMVKENLPQYQALDDANKKQLVEDFSDFRVTKAVGTRISTQSKINDITHTLTAVGTELDNLKARTGVEAILYTTRGTTDLPMKGSMYASEGVEDFMGSVMGLDTPDILSKMEGFAVQGVKGAAQNHAARVTQLRTTIRDMINSKLREITGESQARMHWSSYFRNVVSRYGVVIEGWPDTIPFANLSTACSGITQLEILLCRWETGKTQWKVLSPEELEELRQERNEQLEEIEGRTRRIRSDKGKKHTRKTADEGGSRKKHRSAEFVGDGNDDDNRTPQLGEDDEHGDENRPPPPATDDNTNLEGSSTGATIQTPATNADTNLAASGTGTTMQTDDGTNLEISGGGTATDSTTDGATPAMGRDNGQGNTDGTLSSGTQQTAGNTDTEGGDGVADGFTELQMMLDLTIGVFDGSTASLF